MKTLIILSIALASTLSGCATAGIGQISGTVGYTSPKTGIVYGGSYTRTFTDAKSVKPIR